MDWSAGAVSLLTETRPWPQNGRPRRAAVSSFSISGTNAHFILEQAPIPPEAENSDNTSDLHSGGAAVGGGVGGLMVVPWVLSGKSEPALIAQAGRLLEHLQAHPQVDVADVGVTLAERSVFEHRAVVLGSDRQQLIAGLSGLATPSPGAGVVTGRAASVGKTVLVFPGQGSQWLGMGESLYRQFKVFAEAFDAVADALDQHVRLPLREVVWGYQCAGFAALFRGAALAPF